MSSECIISVLAVLVTVLIGWNVYSAIDIENSLRKSKQRYTRMQRMQDYNSALLYSCYASLEGYAITDVGKHDLKLQMLHAGLISIKYFSIDGNYKECNQVAKILIEALKYTSTDLLTSKEYEGLLLTVGEISNRDRIETLQELVRLISLQTNK